MHVAFVLSALQAGGAERVVAQISREAVARGWTVTIITFERPGDPIYHSLDSGVRFRRLALPVGARGLGAITLQARRIAALRRLFRREAYDAVYSYLTKVNTLVLLGGLGLSVPIIVSERNNPARQRMSPLWTLALRFAYRRADAIVMQTERSKALLPAKVRARAVVIPNPVEQAHGAALDRAPRGLVAVGRLTHQKGFDLLIDAMVPLTRDHSDWRLLVWGEGPDRDALDRQIRDLELEQHVDLCGVSATPGAWTGSGEIFVLSSRYEGWPNVLAEAMAAGMAVVAFDCPFGPAELIRHEETGILVAPEDGAALSAAIGRLIRDPALRASLGSAASASIRPFVPEAIASRWLALARKPDDVVEQAVATYPCAS